MTFQTWDLHGINRFRMHPLLQCSIIVPNHEGQPTFVALGDVEFWRNRVSRL